MNTPAVALGIFYGIVSVVICYGVSLVTSGLFARPFYRLYAKVLIGTCSVMLLAPGLRWLACTADPQIAAIALTLTQYLVVAVVGYGTVRFNRDYLRQVFLQRKATAYFTFGTMANAAIVTLAFLHVSITATPGWRETAVGFVTAGNYGPLLVVLAALLFHTDHHLKSSYSDPRKFSRFTFIGYAVSFVGIALSLMPYVGNALGQLRLVAIGSPLLQNFHSAQALLIAIGLYAWLIWRYESVPPVWLLLLAIIGEYHILVTQWITQQFGMASWGLASLPLFSGIVALEHYFSRWEQRRQKVKAGLENDRSPRVALPFRYVGIGLAVGLICVTLWTRFGMAGANSPGWLGATFASYSLFCGLLAARRGEPKFIYASGLLAALSVLLGVEPMGGPFSTVALGALAAGVVLFVTLGERAGLQLAWRTPLVDCACLFACIVTALVFSRHLTGDTPYYFQIVDVSDAIALGCGTLTFLALAYQYGSRLPVIGAMLALALTVPPWSAAVGLAATLASATLERKLRKEPRGLLSTRVKAFGRFELPAADILPTLYTQPLSACAIPLAYIGLTTSAWSILQGNFDLRILVGTAISALVLGLLTRTYRVHWLAITSLLASYFAVHSITHGLILKSANTGQAMAMHLLLASALSLLGWTVAGIYAAWCGARLKRVAEAEEAEVCAKREFYAAILYHITSLVSVAIVGLTLGVWKYYPSSSTLGLLGAAGISAIVLALAASIYRSQLMTYLALAGISLTLLLGQEALQIVRWDGAAAVVAMVAIVIGCLLMSRRALFPAEAQSSSNFWLPPLPFLSASGLALWTTPLAVYTMVCSLAAVWDVVASGGMPPERFVLSDNAPIVFGLVSVSWLATTVVLRQPLIYIFGITTAFAAVHTAIALPSTWLQSIEEEPWLHLLGAGGMSAGCVLVATSIAVVLNRRAVLGAVELSASPFALRTFYAGILMNCASATSLLTLLGLGSRTLLFGLTDSRSALLNLAVGLLVFATFALLSLVYRSRIQTYCALVAAYFTLLGIVSTWAPALTKGDYLTLSISIFAVLLGVLAWGTVRWNNRVSRHCGELNARSPRLLECWPSLPLPLVSLDASLWATPMANVSVWMSLLAAGFVGHAFSVERSAPAASWLIVLPLYLSAIALFIGTRFSTKRAWVLEGPVSRLGFGDQLARLPVAKVEQGILFLLSLLITAVATHLSAHLILLVGLPMPESLSWHLLLAAFETIMGWTLAASLAAYIKSPASVLEQVESPSGTSDLGLYSRLLHHSVLTLALVNFGFICNFVIRRELPASQVLVAITVLAVYFLLAARTYVAQILTYLAAVVISFSALPLLTILSQDHSNLGISLSLFALGFWAVGFAIEYWLRREQGDSNSRVEFAVRVYEQPLIRYSTFLSALAVGHGLILWLSAGWQTSQAPIVVTAALGTLTLLLNARSLSVLQRDQWARVMVYLACLSLTGCWLAATTMTWDTLRGLGPNAASTALVLAFAGWWLVAGARARHLTRPGTAALRLTFGEPIVHYSAGLVLVALLLTSLAFIQGLPSELAELVALRLDLSQVWATGLTFVLSAVVCFLSATVLKRIAWLDASVVLGSCGLLFLLKSSTDWSGPAMAISSLVLMNLLVALAHTLRSRPTQSETLLGFSRASCLSSCFEWPLVITHTTTLGQCIYLVWAYFLLATQAIAGRESPEQGTEWPWLLINLLCAGVYLQSLNSRRKTELAHFLVGSSLIGFAGSGLTANWLFSPDIAIGLLGLTWGGLGMLLNHTWGAQLARRIGLPLEGEWRAQAEKILRAWATGLLVLALVFSLPVAVVFRPSYPNVFAVLLMTTLAALIGSVRWRNVTSMTMAALLFPMSLGALLFFFEHQQVVLVYGGLLTALLALTYLILGSLIERQGAESAAGSYWIGASNTLGHVSQWLCGSVVILAVTSLLQGIPAYPTVLSLALVSVCWCWGAWRTQKEILAYGAILGFLLTAITGCVAIANIPIVANSVLAFCIIAYCFMLYGINIFVSQSQQANSRVFLKPSFYTALALPLTLIVAIPFNERGPAAFLLLAAGAFYLAVSHQSQTRWTIYVASGLLNFAIYIWLPVAGSINGIYQLYVIPAAITILVIAHLHRQELKPSVLSSIRLTASGCILAVSSFEALYSKDSSSTVLFSVVLLLSLAGIVAGIALRIKPFIYTGLAFLVMNVVFQVGLQFQRTGGIVRAVILIGTGIVVLSVMVFFNIHRERILQQYRMFLADQSWE
jgi:hypothetical protein